MDTSQHKEEIIYIRPPGFEGMELLKASNCRQLWKLYTESSYYIGIPREPKPFMKGKYSGRSFEVTESSPMVLYEPGVTVNISHISGKINDAISFYLLSIPYDFIESMAREFKFPCSPPCLRAPIVYDLEVLQSFKYFLHTLEVPNGLLEQESALINSLHKIFRLCSQEMISGISQQCNEPLAIKHIREFIHANYAKNISLEELAQIAGFSRFYLIRAFKKATGITPHQYQIQLRIKEAQRCIEELEMLESSFAELAFKLGFYDQSHFLQAFKKITGLCPGKYQLQVKIGKAREYMKEFNPSQEEDFLIRLAFELGFSDQSHFGHHFKKLVGATPGKYLQA